MQKPSFLKQAGFKRLLLLCALGLIIVIGIAAYRAATWPDHQPQARDVAEITPASGAAERLAEALRFETVSRHPGEGEMDFEIYEAFLDWLEASFPRSHETLAPERIGEYSLLFRWAGSDPEADPVLLMAHYDVVPVEPGTEDEWTHPPFDGVIEDGLIWGRGALDNKSGVTGILEAAEALLAEGYQPRRTIKFAFGHDEEIGGEDGAKQIAQQLEEEGVALEWVLDEGGLVLEDNDFIDSPAGLIGTAEKGYLSLELEARGPGGHSSQPPERTSVGSLATAIHRLQENPFPARLAPPVTDSLDFLAGELPFAYRMVVANRWLTAPAVRALLASEPTTNAWLSTTTAPTMLRAGDKDNVLPQRASGVVNFRILPGEDSDAVRQRVAEVIDDEAIELSTYGGLQAEPSPVSATDNEAFDKIGGQVRGLWPDVKMLPYLLSGATDSRHFSELADNIYRFLPVRVSEEQLDGIHGTDERVDAESYEEGIRFYISLMKAL